MKRCVPLEPAAEAVCEANSKPPLIFELPPAQGRMALEKAQDSPVYKYPAQVSRVSVNTGRWGTIPVYLVNPGNTPALSNVIFFIHGAGWVFGSYHTHEKLVRELASRTGSLLIFPEYSRSPEARYPVAIEQCYSVLCMGLYRQSGNADRGRGQRGRQYGHGDDNHGKVQERACHP